MYCIARIPSIRASLILVQSFFGLLFECGVLFCFFSSMISKFSGSRLRQVVALDFPMADKIFVSGPGIVTTGDES